MEFEPIKNQKFEIGRTINPFLCNCINCDFMHCPKQNYAVKMRAKQHTIEEIFDKYYSRITQLNKPKLWEVSFKSDFKLVLTYDLINDLMYELNIPFPAGTYWRLGDLYIDDDNIDNCVYDKLELVIISRDGEEICKGSIKISDATIQNYGLNRQQLKLASKLSELFTDIKELMFKNTYSGDYTIGWLSPSGKFYPCGSGEHITLINNLGQSDIIAERDGWVHIIGDEPCDYFYNSRLLSAEQRNWLSAHGFDVDYLNHRYESINW